MNDDIDEALTELCGDRDEVLQRSVKALLGLDLSGDDEKRYYTDFLILDRMVSELWRQDDKVQACFVAEANRFLRDGENDAREMCLERAYERMSDMRLSYLDSEWKLATKELEGNDDVDMWGEVDFGEWTNPKALWIRLSDSHGTTYAQVCIIMESEEAEDDTYASSFVLGACFTVFGFEIVDGWEGFVNPFDEDLTTANWTSSFCTKLDTGVLCEAIVSEVKQLVESHNEKCRREG
jgi:hypothetical protein